MRGRGKDAVVAWCISESVPDHLSYLDRPALVNEQHGGSWKGVAVAVLAGPGMPCWIPSFFVQQADTGM